MFRRGRLEYSGGIITPLQEARDDDVCEMLSAEEGRSLELVMGG